MPVSPKALRLLGAEEEEVMRLKALKVLGLDETAVQESNYYFRGSNVPSPQIRARFVRIYGEEGGEALLRFFGCEMEHILRRKALESLGTAEANIDEDRARRLASYGDARTAARRHTR